MTPSQRDTIAKIAEIALDVGLDCRDRVGARTTLKRAREAIRAIGVEPAPVGIGNGKVGGVSTYRGIKETCPPSCPLFLKCYASEGNVNLHQLRAGGDVVSSVAAFAIGCALVVAGHADAVRLHTSGDFGIEPEPSVPDPDYVEGLKMVSSIVRVGARLRGNLESDGGTLAWTYTHLPPSPERDYMIRSLRAHSIEVLISDEIRAGGAIVMPHNMVPTLRKALRAQSIDVHPIRCPEQTAKAKGRSVSCAQCRLCYDGTAKRRLIVFDPIGGEARKNQQEKWTPAAPLAHVLNYDTRPACRCCGEFTADLQPRAIDDDGGWCDLCMTEIGL
jgi:hypothetical protein